MTRGGWFVGDRCLGAVDVVDGTRVLTRWASVLGVPVIPLGGVGKIQGIGVFEVPLSLRSVCLTASWCWAPAALLLTGWFVLPVWCVAWGIVQLVASALFDTPPPCARDSLLIGSLLFLATTVSGHVLARRAAARSRLSDEMARAPAYAMRANYRTDRAQAGRSRAAAVAR